MSVEDVNVIEGTQAVEGPAIIIPAEFARKMLDAGKLEEHVDAALRGLELSGKNIVLLREYNPEA